MGINVIEQCNATKNGVGFFHLSDRGKIRFSGPDHVSFLHSMFSNEVEELCEWEGRYGTFLTARGKIVSDFFYYKLPGYIIVDIRRDLLDKTRETLAKFIVMDELTMEDISSEKDHFSLQGPAAEDLIKDLCEEQLPSTEFRMLKTEWNGAVLWIIRRNHFSEIGFEIIVNSEFSQALNTHILKKGRGLGLRRISPEVQNILRLEAGTPLYGIDMDESNYPLEARLKTAISLTKGCYIGQEVVAKATHIGGVPNLLMGLKLKGQLVPQARARILVEDSPIGFITSAVFSPRLNCPIALGYIKRAFAQPGTHCSVEVAQEREYFLVAEIVERFIDEDTISQD